MSYTKALLVLITNWLLVIVYYVASNGRLGLIGCFLYYVQTIVIMVSSHSSLTAWLRTFGFSPAALMPSVCLGPMSAELQYAMPLMIAPLQMVQLCITLVAHWLLRRYCSPPQYELHELTMTYVMHGQQAVVVNGQRRYGPVLQCAQHVAALIRYRLWPELTVSTIMRTLFLIVSASFTSVLVTSVSWFNCTENSVMATTSLSASVVYAFPAIACHTSSYVLWSWVMGGCIVTCVLVIASTSWWMFAHRRLLTALQACSPATVDTAARGLLARRSLTLRPCLRSESVDAPLGLAFSSFVYFSRYWPTPHVGDTWDEPVCRTDVDGERMETQREYAFRSVYGALYDSFRSKAIAWVVVMWVRRFLLILLSVMLTTLPSAKYLSFLFLHLAVLGLQVHYQPFATSTLNEAEQVSIVMHTAIAAVLTAYPSPTDSIIQSIVWMLASAPLVPYVLYLPVVRLVVRVMQRKVRLSAGDRQGALSAPLLLSDELEVS